MSHLGHRLSALIDGELNDARRERVLAHLARCEDCRREAAALRLLKQRMHTLGVKLGTVRSRIHRGRAQLRVALEHRRPRQPTRAVARPVSASSVPAGSVPASSVPGGPA